MLLVAYAPQHIVQFCASNPLDVKEHYRFQTNRGGAGDVMPPTPAAEAFFTCLRTRHGQLMTQQEYADYCLQECWAEWAQTLTPWVRECFTARIYRNFYPGCIDALHVWALLSTQCTRQQRQMFDRCVIDTTADVLTKVDLLAYRDDLCLRVALLTNSRAAWESHDYKQQWRGRAPEDTITLPLTVGKALRGPGNKCWYRWPDDFAPLLRRLASMALWP